MANPYREGSGWSIRPLVRGQRLYLSGFKTAAAAQREAARQTAQIENEGAPARLGARRTCLAVALQDYGRERLPSLKGAQQEARRINRYLRAARQDLVALTPVSSAPVAGLAHGEKQAVFWEVTLVQAPPARRVPRGLGPHRAQLGASSAKSDRLRGQLARTPMAEVTRDQLQGFFDALCADKRAPATIALERALLRRIFYYAEESWHWAEPARNPAVGVELPKIDNARNRVLSRKEWKNLCAALDQCTNKYVAPAVALLLETSMRVSEPLLRAHWGDVDWGRAVLELRDSKSGARAVPLGPLALDVLRLLHANRIDERILPLSYEALRSAWNRACAAAGIQDLHLHDLRHTAATRYALEYHGNKFVLKSITGHKTDSQLGRYVNITPEDVARMMHGADFSEHGPAALADGLPHSPQTAVRGARQPGSDVQPADATPRSAEVIRVKFGTRRVA